MATIDLGKIKPIWKGDWVTGTAYEKNDMVKSGTNSYIATAAHTASADFATDSANWDTMAQGADIPSQTGNAGLALKTDGTNLSWGQAGGLVPVFEYSQDGLNVSNVSAQNIFNGDYENYRVVMFMRPTGGDGSTFNYLRFYQEGGSEYSPGSYQNITWGAEGNGSSWNSSQGYVHHNQTDWQLRPAGGGVSSDGNYGGVQLSIDFFHPYSTSFYKRAHGISTMKRVGNDNLMSSNFYAHIDNGDSIRMTGFKCYFSNTNVAEFKINVYGYGGV